MKNAPPKLKLAIIDPTRKNFVFLVGEFVSTNIKLLALETVM